MVPGQGLCQKVLVGFQDNKIKSPPCDLQYTFPFSEHLSFTMTIIICRKCSIFNITHGPVDPDTAGDEPAAEEEGDEGLHGVGGLRVLLAPRLRPPHAAQHADEVFKCRERA